MSILKPSKNLSGRAAKSIKYIKNNNNIFGGQKKPCQDKTFIAKNIKRQNKNRPFSLISGYNMAFDDQTEFKLWLNGLNMAIFKPVNIKHNLSPALTNSPLYHDKFIINFNIMVRDNTY